jgi:CubicO group peptidase (beta-lactamase class C family)
MRRIKWGVVFAFALLFVPHFAVAQSDNPQLKAAVGKLVGNAGVKSNEPGVAVLAMRDGRPLVMEGYGLANLANKETITPCTNFELASVSKTFTATAVLILQERGLLSINDDVRKYLPELPQYAKGPMRIRHLLNHTSGLTDYLDLNGVEKSHKTYWVNNDYLPALGKAELDFAIGQKYEYNNTNYMLLALVVERAAGKPFAEVMQDEIFVPAGMKGTFVNSAAPPGSVPPCSNAIGYENDNKRWIARWGVPPNHRLEQHLEVGDGAIWSNLKDMARWDVALRTNKLLKPATLQLALTGSTQEKDYGLGWQVYRERGGPLYGYGHDGYWRGFNTMYYHYVTNNHTVVLLSNRGREFDLDDLWEKISAAIDTHAKD